MSQISLTVGNSTNTQISNEPVHTLHFISEVKSANKQKDRASVIVHVQYRKNTQVNNKTPTNKKQMYSKTTKRTMILSTLTILGQEMSLA